MINKNKKRSYVFVGLLGRSDPKWLLGHRRLGSDKL